MRNIGDMYHWRSKNAGPQKQLPWGMFFDIDSLQKYIPVMEMYNFLEGTSIRYSPSMIVRNVPLITIFCRIS